MGVRAMRLPCGWVGDGPTGKVTHHCDEHAPKLGAVCGHDHLARQCRECELEAKVQRLEIDNLALWDVARKAEDWIRSRRQAERKWNERGSKWRTRKVTEGAEDGMKGKPMTNEELCKEAVLHGIDNLSDVDPVARFKDRIAIRVRIGMCVLSGLSAIVRADSPDGKHADTVLEEWSQSGANWGTAYLEIEESIRRASCAVRESCI